MVLRHDAAGVLAIGQPAHALLCGQFARAWGNGRFAAPEPRDDVALGAEQHDVGWADFDLEPEYNPDTGLPRGFTEVPLATSTALWRGGPRRLESQSRYAALLATRHGRRLFERIDLARHPPADAALVTALLADGDAHERALRDALQADPAAAPGASAELVARNSDLVWTWDSLSLALLLDWAPHTLSGVPTTAGGAVDIALRAVATRESAPTVSLSPWPFADPVEVIVRTEGRRLDGPCESAEALAASLAAAPWETVAFALVPAPPER